MLVFTGADKNGCSNWPRYVAVISNVQNLSVIPMSRLSPYAKEIIMDFDEIDGVVIGDPTSIRCLRKMGIKLDITAAILQTSGKSKTDSGGKFCAGFYSLRF
jgi:hypothetical protein